MRTSLAPIVPRRLSSGLRGARARLAPSGFGNSLARPSPLPWAPQSPRRRRAGRDSCAEPPWEPPRAPGRSRFPGPGPSRSARGVLGRSEGWRGRSAPSRDSGEKGRARGPGLNLLVTMHISTSEMSRSGVEMKTPFSGLAVR